ncbi:MAG: IS1634 family transposase [Acidimicrobiales bacterium]|nr:IS1634 family transposase [Acidimicrobiales bacterium]MYB82356.1 IS1634 family transposase [Acidimicrobiales bacterium]MYI13447.1 IS1634 family transposase [Acidimicrobiales bacterium]
MLLGVFVKTTRRRRGDKTYEYLSLVESVREGPKTRHRTLLRLGEVTALRDSGQLERIVAVLEAHLRRERGCVDAGALAAEGAPAAGGVAAVRAVWQRLGLGGFFDAVGARRGSEALADAVFAMTANRLVAPCSKRRMGEWAERDVAMPAGWSAPSADQYYRALDAVADAKTDAEEHLYSRLCDLTNMDLALVCYDLTSTYFEAPGQRSDRFPSRAFGYSRDHRGDRPQVVIGLLCTGDGIPIAHHTFAGNTADASTLPGVLEDLAGRFAVGRICVVADRGLISTANVEAVGAAGFDHVLATKLRRDRAAEEALHAIDDRTAWVDMADHRCRAAETPLADGTRAVVVESDARARRDTARTAELVARAETALLGLEHRVRSGRLADPAKIGRAAPRILGPSGVSRLFDLDIGQGRFVYHYDEAAHAWDKLLAGRYVLTTSLAHEQADTARVVAAYRQLAGVEARFQTLKDFLKLRPIRHWTEHRVRGHIAVCVWAAVIETLIAKDLAAADIADPDQPEQHLTAPRALRELDRIRRVHLTAAGRSIELTTRRSPLQASILTAIGADTRHWDNTHIG